MPAPLELGVGGQDLEMEALGAGEGAEEAVAGFDLGGSEGVEVLRVGVAAD